MIPSSEVITGDTRDILELLPDRSVQCCITSPPYYGLRDYGVVGQIGLEQTPDEYVAQLVAVFREVRRVLRDDGTLWLNLGDSYAAALKGTGGQNSPKHQIKGQANFQEFAGGARHFDLAAGGLKPKDLVGIPWRVAFALQADGWYLRSDIIWHKPNPMPESITDRPTKSHEYLFLLAKSERYYYDNVASAEPAIHAGRLVKALGRGAKNGQKGDFDATAAGFTEHDTLVGATRNRRTVWTISTKPFKGAHFATFPPDLVEPCILAGSKPGDTVLDPFNGAGTTGVVAKQHGRCYVGVELNPEYATMARERIAAA